MPDSTLEIHTQLLGALQALEGAAGGRIDAGDIEAAAAALDFDELEAHVQSLESMAQAWDAAEADHTEGLTDALTNRHEAAVTEAYTVLDSMPADLDADGKTLADQADKVQTNLKNFRRVDSGIRTELVEQNDHLADRARALAGIYEDHYQQLHQEFAQFGSLLKQQLQPVMDRQVGEWLAGLQAFRLDKLGAVNAELRDTFSNATQQYMDLAENVANVYRDAARSASTDLEKLATDRISAMLDKSVERLKNTAISMVEEEIAQAIGETGLSVAITSALSPIMPQLIAFYKAVTLLEEAIRIYKEMKSALSFGL